MTIKNYSKEMINRMPSDLKYFKPYAGKVIDLDLSKDWYCPHCEDVPKLVTTSDGNSMYCPTRFEECDYTFNNETIRVATNEVWGINFKYPLTYKERLVKLIALSNSKIDNAKKMRTNLFRSIKKETNLLASLEDELNNL